MLPSQHYHQPEAGAVLTALHEINVALRLSARRRGPPGRQ